MTRMVNETDAPPLPTIANFNDWLWYHPCKFRGQQTHTHLYGCKNCDVIQAVTGVEALQGVGAKPRCWNCGRFVKYYKFISLFGG